MPTEYNYQRECDDIDEINSENAEEKRQKQLIAKCVRIEEARFEAGTVFKQEANNG